MQNNDNQKTYFIYVRSTAEKVPVTKAQHDSFYKEADRIRHKEQDHGRCIHRQCVIRHERLRYGCLRGGLPS